MRVINEVGYTENENFNFLSQFKLETWNNFQIFIETTYYKNNRKHHKNIKLLMFLLYHQLHSWYYCLNFLV